VQGASAPESLREALARLIVDGRSDVIIIGRGGGSAADLSAFNDEGLVRAVFGSPIPIVSAVGHETDWTLLDLVADVRSPTPSAAAELCAFPVLPALQLARMGLSRCRGAYSRSLMDQMLDLSATREHLARIGPSSMIEGARNHVASQEGLMRSLTRRALDDRGAARRAALRDIKLRSSATLRSLTDRRRYATGLLGVLDPGATLGRGYAVLSEIATGMPIDSIGQVAPGGRVRATVRDGAVDATVERVAAGG
jgi:exodeoxyribonuclease VII large subunit